MRILIGVLTFLSLTNAAQAYTCRELFILRPTLKRFEVQTHFRIYYTRDKIEERLLLEDLALSEPVTAYLEKPTKTHVKITNQSENELIIGGGFAMETGAGQVYVQPRLLLDRTVKGALVRSSVVLHEYGHALFFANMARYSRKWGEWYRYATRNWLQTVFSMSAREEELWLDKRLVEISYSYQEVFADLVAVLSLREPTAMAQTIEYLDRNHPKQIQSRDFTTNTLMSYWTHTRTHDILAPVRSFLWERYFSQVRSRDEEAKILARVFEVMASEINERYDNRLLDALPPELLNRRLLRALELELREFEVE